MGLLDFLSPALTVATQAAGAQVKGQQDGSALLRAIRMQQADMDSKRSTVAKNNAETENYKSETAHRNDPKPGTIHQADDGTLYSVRDGVATPVTIGGSSAPAARPAPAPGGQPTGDVTLPSDSTPAAPKPPTVLKGKASAPLPGTPAWRKAEIDKAVIGRDYGYHPPQTPQLLTGAVGPDGPTYGEYDKKTHTIKAVPSEGLRPKSASGAGGQNAPQMAAAKANLESARKLMNDYEDKLVAGKADYGVMGATEGALASSPAALTAHGPWDAAMSLASNAAASHLQSSNPELARYMTAKKYVAEAILNTHKRPNQTQYEIEQELSGAGPNASPMQIAVGRERRDRMYNEVFANPNAGAVASSGAPAASHGATASHAQSLWDAAVHLHGEAKVRAEYGPRPEE